MMRMARPSHPGQFVRMEIIEPLNLSVTKAAKILGVTRPALSAVLNRRASLSPDMALRIEKAFGPKMDTLLRMQTAYEIARPGKGKARSRSNGTSHKRQRLHRRPAAGICDISTFANLSKIGTLLSLITSPV